MWHRELLTKLHSERPRWRWKSHLNSRGGTLDGETQKQSVHLEIDHARGHWTFSAHGLIGRRQPQWALTVDNAKASSVDELANLILTECT